MNGRMLLVPALLLVAGCGVEGRQDEASSVSISAPAADEKGPVAERRIIYTATIDLVVQDFSTTQEALTEMVAAAKGYVATFREDRPTTAQRGGKWVVRLPAIEFDRFTRQVLELGIPTSRQTDAQDVTEQHIDLTARLNNKKRMEERVLKLLEERGSDIKDVIEVESQLGRIREEIETLEGKVRYLSDRVAMTTVTISARQDANYFPAAPPTFAGKAWTTLLQSLAAMQELAEGIALAVVALSPWLVLGVILLMPLAVVAVYWRRRVRLYRTPR